MNPPEREPSYSVETRSNADDVELVRRMVEADETALGALYDRWSRPLYSLVLQLTRDPLEAEDVVEDTFWQAWKKAAAYEPARGAVSTWLFTIGRRKALDRLRSRKRKKEDHPGREPSLAELVSTDPDPLQDTAGAELREHVQAALADLPVEQREVLDLAYFSGMSQTEIAEATGLPLGTIKTRVRLAMQKLREPLSVHRETTE
jgi:RNA polymerase sigma-70 factor (ECF subfamily)